MSLAALAQFAVSNNNSTAAPRIPLHELSIADARAKVAVKNGNKKVKEDGSQALTLTLGKHRLSLEVIAPNATRLNIAGDQVEAVSATLLEAVANGDFDEAIIAAQAKANPANRPVKAPVVSGEEATEENTAPEGVDLDVLGGDDTFSEPEGSVFDEAGLEELG